MDSISQAVLGAGIGGLWAKKLGKKVLPWGMAIATIPDLDVFVGPLLYGNTLLADFFHRGPMHSLVFCVLLAPLLASFFRFVFYRKEGTWGAWFRFCLFALLTHVLLDSLTNYGTRLFWPFSDLAVSINSVFIVDPLYTVPFFLLILVALFVKKKSLIKKLCVWGLSISSLYLILGLGIKRWLHPQVVTAYSDAGFECQEIMTTPEAFQILLWKAVAQCGNQVVESWYHVLDGGENLTAGSSRVVGRSDRDGFVIWQRNAAGILPLANRPLIAGVLKKTMGYYIVVEDTEDYLLYDMRFGRLAGWRFDSPPSFFRYRIDALGIKEDDNRYEGRFPEGVFSELFRVVFRKK